MPLPALSVPARAAAGALAALFALIAPAARAAAPALDRVVVVVMENKSFAQVATQPYTASLRALGVTFSQSFGVAHPSQPNYIALWAGSTLAVTNNNCPPAGSPFSAENLGHALEAAGKTWKAYSENLAVAGSSACSFDGDAASGLYTRKHEPWTQFANLNHQNERPYGDLAADLAADQLPNLAFVIPNNCHNSHNSTTAGCTVPDADTWLSQNLPPILGRLGPNGLLVLTWDEDDNVSNNRVLTVFAGPRVIPGMISTQVITHYTLVRMLCEALGLAPFAGAAGEASISNVWATPVPARGTSWGALKAIYR